MADMTRGQFIFKLVQELGLPVSADVVGAGFADTDGTYLDAVVTSALNAGIITSADRFRATDVVSREEAATMIARAFDLSADGPATFSDVGIDQWYSESIAAVQQAGVFSGIGGGQFGLGQGFDSRFFDQVIDAARNVGATPPPPGDPITPTTPNTTPTNTGGTAEAGEFTRTDEIASIIALLESSYDMTGMDAWVERMMIEPTMTRDQLLLDLRETPQFQERWKIIQAVQDAGLPPMSVQNALEYEAGMRANMVAAGFPPGFYDSPEDFVDLAVHGWTVDKVAEKVNLVADLVTQTPIEVREAYADMFGPRGDEALMMYYMDPEKSAPVLEREIDAASVKGMADRFGISVSGNRALELADLGVDQELAFTGFSRLAAMQPVFAETFGERIDLEADTAGVAAEFENDPEARRAIERRVQSRTAEFSGGGGGLLTNEGVLGAG